MSLGYYPKEVEDSSGNKILEFRTLNGDEYDYFDEIDYIMKTCLKLSNLNLLKNIVGLNPALMDEKNFSKAPENLIDFTNPVIIKKSSEFNESGYAKDIYRILWNNPEKTEVTLKNQKLFTEAIRQSPELKQLIIDRITELKKSEIQVLIEAQEKKDEPEVVSNNSNLQTPDASVNNVLTTPNPSIQDQVSSDRDIEPTPQPDTQNSDPVTPSTSPDTQDGDDPQDPTIPESKIKSDLEPINSDDYNVEAQNVNPEDLDNTGSTLTDLSDSNTDPLREDLVAQLPEEANEDQTSDPESSDQPNSIEPEKQLTDIDDDASKPVITSNDKIEDEADVSPLNNIDSGNLITDPQVESFNPEALSQNSDSDIPDVSFDTSNNIDDTENNNIDNEIDVSLSANRYKVDNKSEELDTLEILKSSLYNILTKDKKYEETELMTLEFIPTGIKNNIGNYFHIYDNENKKSKTVIQLKKKTQDIVKNIKAVMGSQPFTITFDPKYILDISKKNK